MHIVRVAILGLLLLLPKAASAQDSMPTLYLPAVANTRQCSALPSTPFGVQMYGDTGQSSSSFPFLLDSGARWVRAPIDWEKVEPANVAPEEYDWSHADGAVGAARDGCFHMIITHSSDPAWAAADSILPVAPSALPDLVEYLGALVERYDGDGVDDAPGSPVVRHWELYNEPDDTIPLDGARWGYYGEEYAQLLAIAYPVIKAADPQAQVLFGGIAHDWYEEQGSPFFRGFLDDVLEAGGGAYFDIMNFHTYPPFAASWTTQGPGLYEKTLFMRDKLAQYGLDKPVMITESCHHNNDVLGLPGSDEMQMRYVVQLYTQSLAAGVQVMVWFALVDPGGLYPFDSGLITDDNPHRLKPAYSVYQVAAAELGSVRFEQKLSAAQTGSDAMEAYKFRNTKTGQLVYVAWLDPVDTTDAEPLSISATRATIRDIFGEPTLIEDRDDGSLDGRLHVTVTGRPVYIEVGP